MPALRMKRVEVVEPGRSDIFVIVGFLLSVVVLVLILQGYRSESSWRLGFLVTM